MWCDYRQVSGFHCNDKWRGGGTISVTLLAQVSSCVTTIRIVTPPSHRGCSRIILFPTLNAKRSHVSTHEDMHLISKADYYNLVVWDDKVNLL